MFDKINANELFNTSFTITQSRRRILFSFSILFFICLLHTLKLLESL